MLSIFDYFPPNIILVMFEQVQEYIKSNASTVMWVMIVMIVVIAYQFYKSRPVKSEPNKKKKIKKMEEDLKKGELPTAEQDDSKQVSMNEFDDL